MIKRLISVSLLIGAFSIHFVSSFVQNTLSNTSIQSMLFDQTEGKCYIARDAVYGGVGILQASAPVDSNSPSFSAFQTTATLPTNRGYKNLVMVNDQTSQLPVTLAAVVQDPNTGLYSRFAVFHNKAYATSEAVEDDLTNPQSGYNPYAPYSPYGSYAPYTDPYGVAYAAYNSTYTTNTYVYGNAANDSEILALAAAPNAVFAVTHRITNPSFLMSGTALNAHLVNVTASSITIQPNTSAYQRSLDSRDFIVGRGRQEVFAVSNDVHLCYNNDLKTLYCAPTWITSSANGNDVGVCSVAGYKFDAANSTLSPLSFNSLSSWGNGTNTQNIIGVSGISKTLSAHQIGVMKTSQSKYYLIVLGGNGDVTTTGNYAYALPLVGPNGTTPGSLAQVSDTTRLKSATSASDLYTAANVPAIVGGGQLPWAGGSNGYGMVVLGDAIYVSVENAMVTTPGIYYSQANFDHNGNISGWSSWALAVPRALGSDAEGDDNQGAVATFAVNTVSGKVWVVPSDATGTVRVPSWTRSTLTPSVKRSEWNPVMDVKQWSSLKNKRITRAANVIDANVAPQEKLFTTINNISATCNWKVLDAAGNPVYMSAYAGKSITSGLQKIVIIRSANDDLTTTTANYKVIDAPTQTELVLAVGFSQASGSNAQTGMLFVGTTTGLYAYVDGNNKGGYVASSGVNNANTSDLSTGYWNETKLNWKKIHSGTFNNNIQSIDCLNNNLYILQRSTSFEVPDTIYGFTINDIAQNTIVNATPLLVYKAGRDSANPYILSTVVIPLIGEELKDALLIGTFAGVHALTANGGITLTNTLSALTTLLVPGTENTSARKLIRTSNNQVDVQGLSTDNKNVTHSTFVSPSTNGNVTAAVTSTSTTTSKVSAATGSQVWTDGARKLSIANNKLISQDGSATAEQISKLESKVFMSGENLTSISIIGGIINVTTDQGTIYLK